MAIVIRYFGVTGAGLENASDYNNRAPLLVGGNWNTTYITSFAFNASDSLECRVGPGGYTCSQSLDSSLFTNPPTAANPLVLHGCDSSGSRLAPPAQWSPARGLFDSSGFPEITYTPNSNFVSVANAWMRCLKVVASGRTGGVVIDRAEMMWVHLRVTSSGTSVAGISDNLGRVANCQIEMAGAEYASGMSAATGGTYDRILVIGNKSGSTGTRRGINMTNTTSGCALTNIVSRGHGGAGFQSTSTNAAQRFFVGNCLAIDNGGSGFELASTASQVGITYLYDSIATANGAYGINAQSAARVFLSRCRLRNNTSGNTPNGMGNNPADLDVDTSSGADADEFVNAGSGDYRIKYGSALWGKGIGCGDGPATITG